MKNFLVAAADHAVHEAIRDCFGPGMRVDHAPSREACFERLGRKRYEFIFVDAALVRDPEAPSDWKRDLQPLWHAAPGAELIVMSSVEMIRELVNAVKAGASNYLTWPINPDEVRYVTESLIESLKIQSEIDYLRDRFWETDSLEEIRTNSPLMREVYAKVRAVAPTRSTVLLAGETGTGKSLLAKLIHRHSAVRDAQFISVHCGGIPDTLIESELFGHEKGSFTGAVRRRLGRFEIAQGGSIFLDEIGTIAPSTQIKLLQVLQDRTFHRVGGEESIEADVRVIVATNSDLERMCDEGQFRRDLYYRLAVFPITVPPLRERLEDIPLLVEVFLRRLAQFNNREMRGVHPDVMEAFTRYAWPGNIRELQNLIERAYILEKSSILTPESFPSELFTGEHLSTRIPLDTSLSLAEVRRRSLENVERNYLRELLAEQRGRINRTAAAAGITTRHLHKLLTKYEIRKEDFR